MGSWHVRGERNISWVPTLHRHCMWITWWASWCLLSTQPPALRTTPKSTHGIRLSASFFYQHNSESSWPNPPLPPAEQKSWDHSLSLFLFKFLFFWSPYVVLLGSYKAYQGNEGIINNSKINRWPTSFTIKLLIPWYFRSTHRCADCKTQLFICSGNAKQRGLHLAEKNKL